MTKEKFDREAEQKKLVLERFKTLNPDAKILLGEENEIKVRELIEHINAGDDLGKKSMHVQIKMLQILASVP